MDPGCPSCVVEDVEVLCSGDISTVYEMRCSEPAHSVMLKVYPDAFGWKMDKEVYVYGSLSRWEVMSCATVLRLSS
jgi:hygromycin-B 7''-O-kinase